MRSLTEQALGCASVPKKPAGTEEARFVEIHDQSAMPCFCRNAKRPVANLSVVLSLGDRSRFLNLVEGLRLQP